MPLIPPKIEILSWEEELGSELSQKEQVKKTKDLHTYSPRLIDTNSAYLRGH
jgi:hypothetical protein